MLTGQQLRRCKYMAVAREGLEIAIPLELMDFQTWM